MPNLKISELPEIPGIQDDFPFVVVDTVSNVTSKVSITGMTFQGGTTNFNSISSNSLVLPLNIVGDGTRILFTGTTIDIKRNEANAFVSVLLTYKTDQQTLTSSFEVEVDANPSTLFEMISNSTGEWVSMNVVFPAFNLNSGTINIELYMTLENTVSFDFGQVYISATEL